MISTRQSNLCYKGAAVLQGAPSKDEVGTTQQPDAGAAAGAETEREAVERDQDAPNGDAGEVEAARKAERERRAAKAQVPQGEGS